MKLSVASSKAIKYACLNFHYAKSVPVNPFGFSVFNDEGEWCGVVLFSLGANSNLPTMFGLRQGQACELVRMALNGKHGITSKVLALAMKLIKTKLPLCKILASYSDRNQGHYGIIYQATNWIYCGDSSVKTTTVINGKRMHDKSIYGKYGTNKIEELRKKGLTVEQVKNEPKHRYIYPLDISLLPLCRGMAKPFPKKAAEA